MGWQINYCNERVAKESMNYTKLEVGMTVELL